MNAVRRWVRSYVTEVREGFGLSPRWLKAVVVVGALLVVALVAATGSQSVLLTGSLGIFMVLSTVRMRANYRMNSRRSRGSEQSR